jgi:hypothetical protein
LPWIELAFTVRWLMNARGLIELILLTTGLQVAIITPTLFTILVLVAIVTTPHGHPDFRARLWGAPGERPASGDRGLEHTA